MSDTSGNQRPAAPAIATTLGAHVTEVFADGLAGVAVHAGTVRVSLFSTSFDPTTNTMSRVISSRLILPLSEFEAFRRSLDGVAERLQEAAKAAAQPAAEGPRPS
jgi:hypothetical protein